MDERGGHVFTVLGEALLDMVQPTSGDTYRALPAGGPLNIAVGLRRLGHPTSMMARFSTGALGGQVREFARGAGLDLSASVDTDRQTTLAFASIDEHGRASYDFYVRDTADWGWSPGELAAYPADSQAIHTGSLATAVEPGASHIAEWWADLADAGKVLLSFDPNVRPALAGPRESAVQRVERMVSLSHLVKASDEDLGWLYPDTDPAEALRHWAGMGPALAVLTQGPDGCLAVRADMSVVDVSAPKITLVDTIGAGDAFQAGLLSGLADAGGLAPTAIGSLSTGAVRSILQRAVTVAALTCERAGADPPTRREYDESNSR